MSLALSVADGGICGFSANEVCEFALIMFKGKPRDYVAFWDTNYMRENGVLRYVPTDWNETDE